MTRLLLLTFFLGLGSCIPQYGETGGTSGQQQFTTCNPQTSECTLRDHCDENGFIITDGSGFIDIRIQPLPCFNQHYPGEPSICCKFPPEPLNSCIAQDECVDYDYCDNNGFIVETPFDGSGLIDIRNRPHTQCYTPSNQIGVCCRPGRPLLSTCIGSICTEKHACSGRALDLTNSFVDYISNGVYQECSTPHGNAGVCCLSRHSQCPDPTNVGCVTGGTCLGKGLDGLGNFVDYLAAAKTHTWQDCVLGQGAYGVCCQQPIKQIIQECPGQSICKSYDFCEGNVYDNSGEYVPYVPGGGYPECTIVGDIKGVCCVNKDPLLPVQSQCGIRNDVLRTTSSLDTRIKSPNANNEAQFAEFPWMAIIFYQNYTYVCGASLVSEKYIITSAHCFTKHPRGSPQSPIPNYLPASYFRVRLGEWQVNTYDEPLPYLDVDIINILTLDTFNHRNMQNAIAIAELAEPVPFSYHINTVCLPDTYYKPLINQRCFTTGWGKNEFLGNFQPILKEVELPFVEHEHCEQLLRRTRLGPRFKLHNSFTCAGGEANRDACYGDGGGPLVCQAPDTNQYVLAGVTAWGIDCGEPGVPGVYIDVAYFSDWLKNNLRDGYNYQYFGQG